MSFKKKKTHQNEKKKGDGVSISVGDVKIGVVGVVSFGHGDGVVSVVVVVVDGAKKWG